MLRVHARRLKSAAPRFHFLQLPILAGPLRGCRWTLSSRGKLARILLGTYETGQTTVFQELVGPGDIVYDVGANVGYYSLLASILVQDAGRVVAFEPAENNLFHLRKNLGINQRENVHVLGEAVGPRAGVVRFTSDLSSGTGTGRVKDDGDIEVRQCRLDDVVEELGLAPKLIKIDVEGAEMGVLRGAHRTLTQMRPRLLLSTHNRAAHRACVHYLKSIGYAILPLDGFTVDSSYELLCAADAKVARRLRAG